MQKYILAHDMGTSSDKALLVTVTGEIAGMTKIHYPIYHPQPGYAEQEPEDWWKALCSTSRELLKQNKVSPRAVVGITFSSQTQSLIPISSEGKPLRRSFSWLDGRSADILREKLWTHPRIMGYNIFHLLRFLIITGGCPGHTGKDQIGKILWMREYEPELFARTYKFLDAKDYIIFKLTGNIVISADLAYIWWLLDTRKNRNRWHPGLLKLAGIRLDQLPEVKESAAIAGVLTKEAARDTGLLAGTPVINGCGDLSAAALGSGALDEGEMHICVGTSGWGAGDFNKRRLDIPHYTGCIGSANPAEYYLGMAHQETAGICLEWLKDHILYHKEQLKQEKHVAEVYEILDELAARGGAGAGGLMFTPWMYGERCPLDDDYVRAGLFNVGLNHSREHLVRAVFEGIGFNTRWAMETLEKLYKPAHKMNIVGGGAKSDIWCQIIADITNRSIHRVKNPQLAGARGVALLASMSLGYLKSFADIKSHIEIDGVFKPDPKYRELYDRLFREYKNIYKQNRKWYKRMNSTKD